MRDIIGWSEGDSILAPGGSISNMYAIIIARHKHFPQHKQSGMVGLGKTPVLYTSKHVRSLFSLFTGIFSILFQSHYSVKGAAASLGIGTDNVREVDVDERGRMDPEHLRKLIEDDKKKGFYPFFVNATAGTTVIGAFDPINAIADVCQEHGIWLHIDVR